MARIIDLPEINERKKEPGFDIPKKRSETSGLEIGCAFALILGFIVICVSLFLAMVVGSVKLAGWVIGL